MAFPERFSNLPDYAFPRLRKLLDAYAPGGTPIAMTIGEPRHAILTYSRVGEDYVVAGTAGGSTRAPDWVANMRGHPDVTVEIGHRSFPARATVVQDEAARQRLWDAHVAALPWFASYPEQAQRPIPMIRLTPAAAWAAGDA